MSSSASTGVERVAVVCQKLISPAGYDEVGSAKSPDEIKILADRLQVAQDDDYADSAVCKTVDLLLYRDGDGGVNPYPPGN